MAGSAPMPKPSRTGAFVLAVPALLHCGVALFAWALQSDTPPRRAPSAARREAGASAANEGDGSRDSRDSLLFDDPLAGAPEAMRELARPPSGFDPLRPLDPRVERLRAQAGRAKLFADGALVGRSDVRGAYRIEFAHDVLDGATTVAAIAEAVGSIRRSRRATRSTASAQPASR